MEMFTKKEKDMKILYRILLPIMIAAMLCAFALRVGAADHAEYKIENDGSDYLLSYITGTDTAPIMRSERLSELFEYIAGGGGRIFFEDIASSERIVICGELTFSGRLAIDGGIEIGSGASLSLDGIALSLASEPIRVKDGRLDILTGTEITSRSSAVVSDYSARAEILILGGSIKCMSASSAVVNSLGTLTVRGGEIESTLGYAVENSSSVKLAGAPRLVGREHAVVTDTPISLSDASGVFSGSVSIKYRDSFAMGTLTPVFYNADARAAEGIALYDERGLLESVTVFESYNGIGERNFGAVYKPHTVRYIDGGAVVRIDRHLTGEPLTPPPQREISGYRADGWSLEDGSGNIYDLAKRVEGSMELYSVSRLLPPSFSISSGTFVYDGAAHTFGLTELWHPIADAGEFSFEWYKDGTPTAFVTQRFDVSSVADSGRYYAKISFSDGKGTVSVTTPTVSLTVERMEISLPEIPDLIYTGFEQAPELPFSEYYSVVSASGTGVGRYAVAFTLKDAENTRFSDTDERSVYAEYAILPAENRWLTPPAVRDTYFGMEPSPRGEALFGTPTYLYSGERDGIYEKTPPAETGEWYMRAEIAGSENYTPLSSEPVLFSVLAECVVGIVTKVPPVKTEYTAFDSFDPAGLVLTVFYNSGRSVDISGSEASLEYMSAGNLRALDTHVILYYGGSSVKVPISVKRASYDLSGIMFGDSETVYSGIMSAPVLMGSLPVGLDGIPLLGEIMGGGVNAGTYTVLLSFKSDSKNYILPDALSAEFRILPLEREVIWSGLTHVYDGEVKVPAASYTDISGRSIPLTVYGGRSHAGEYSAVAASNDPNYKLKNASCTFAVERAPLDLSGIFWTGGGEVYDGSAHTVTLGGLPDGVAVIGYGNASATDAGRYIAEASLMYDGANYLPPPPITFEWEIKKAVYDTSGFSFLDSVAVYDGREHFPELSGSMPIGLDGSALSYSFTDGAVHVADGTVTVEIAFRSESENYTAPDSISRTVAVTPAPISVVWQDLTVKFNTGMQLPSASSPFTAVLVKGGGVDAGEYTAIAEPLSTDYQIVNNSVKFVIERAENAWIDLPSVSDIFFGREPKPSGKALCDDVVFLYYSDPECTAETDVGAPGIYYMTACARGNKNYLPMNSEPIKFEVVAILPVGLGITLLKSGLTAFERLAPDDFAAFYINNDGSTRNIDLPISVIYQNGDSLRAADREITFSVDGFSKSVPISVGRAEYDISGVRWSADRFIYNGDVCSVTLLGLPAGITVREYIGASETDAGRYTASAYLEYDSENYYPPHIPECNFEIARAVVPLPTIAPVTYVGRGVLPDIPSSSLYTATAEEGLAAGSYSVSISLTDPKNYTFPSGETAERIYYSVIPRVIGVKVSDLKKYILSPLEKPSYAITYGGVCYGDTVNIILDVGGDRISAFTDNANYILDVEEGRIEYINSLHPDTVFWGSLIFVLLLLLLLILWFLLADRRFITEKLAKLKCRLSYARADASPPPMSLSAPPTDNDGGDAESVLAIDAERADSLITDSLARDLIRRDDSIVYTDGRRKRIINVDTLSEIFSAGDRVDVNVLKAKSLIPYDTAYIKVLARGVLNKPLSVYANDFSLAAVKMIALTGGEAVRVVTMPRSAEPEGEEN